MFWKMLKLWTSLGWGGSAAVKKTALKQRAPPSATQLSGMPSGCLFWQREPAGKIVALGQNVLLQKKVLPSFKMIEFAWLFFLLISFDIFEFPSRIVLFCGTFDHMDQKNGYNPLGQRFWYRLFIPFWGRIVASCHVFTMCLQFFLKVSSQPWSVGVWRKVHPRSWKKVWNYSRCVVMFTKHLKTFEQRRR